MAKLNTYLNFDGNAEEAFNFYKSIFGGEFAAISRYGDTPGCGEMEISEENKNKIVHIALPIGDKGDILMATDVIEAFGQEFKQGNNISISISAESKEEADKLYGGLSAGGKAVMPMADSFWGSYFGMLHDKFGIDWLIDYDSKYAEK